MRAREKNGQRLGRRTAGTDLRRLLRGAGRTAPQAAPKKEAKVKEAAAAVEFPQSPHLLGVENLGARVPRACSCRGLLRRAIAAHRSAPTISQRPPNIAILAEDGTLLANRGDTGGAAVHLSELPAYLPKAFVAIEDRRFYDHWGVDPIGILRALVRDALHRGGMEGGSTLTQQLARNLFSCTQERTLPRKIQEAILAVWLEHKYSKDQILELYLNRVYFGAGAFGVEAAAQKYFGHSARNVSLAEAAMLAGLMKAPSRYAPNHNLAAATQRAGELIAAMRDQGFITPAMAQLALDEPAKPTAKPKAGGTINYVADYVMDQLDDLSGLWTKIFPSPRRSPRRSRQRRRKPCANCSPPRARYYDVSQGAVVALDPDWRLARV